MSNSKTTHAVIFWEAEKSFSCVKISKIENLNIPVGEMVGHEFQIKWNKVFETGKVMGTGSKAEMKKLEDDLAEKAAELSFAEAELNESLKLYDRKKRARKHPFGSESVVSPKRKALDPVKFGALKAFTVQTCGLQKGTLEMINFEQKLKNIPGDARKKLKNLQKST